jgi:hypothetical protein
MVQFSSAIKFNSTCVAALCLLSTTSIARADDLTADQIAQRIVKGNGFTWEGAHTKLRMVLIDDKGARSERALDVEGRRHAGRLESKVRFLSPDDIAGTGFLMIEKPSGGSEQYIYLPGLKRLRRINGREREGSFMGSDFTYADLNRPEDKDAKQVKLPDEKIGSDDAYVLETTSSSVEKSGYSKLDTWVRKKDFIPIRTRFYAPDGKLQKTLYVRRTRDIDGKPAVVEALMKAESGHSTELYVDDVQRREDLPDDDFIPSALER